MSEQHILRRRAAPPPSPAPSRSPERARLADSIAAHAAAVEQANTVEDARGHIADRLYALADAVRQAMDELERARADAPQRLIAAVMGGETLIASPVAAAERTLAEARAAVEEARTARSMLSDEAADCEKAVAEAQRALDAAVIAAVAIDPAVLALRHGFDRARLRLTGLARLLLSLPAAAQPEELRVRGLVHRTDRFAITISPISVSNPLGGDQKFVPDPLWAAAIADLKSDADTRLPDLLPDPEPDPPLPDPPEPDDDRPLAA